MHSSSNRNYGCRITEFIFQGMRTIVLENDVLRVGILVDKGAEIYEFLHKPTDTDFMWRSWLGIRNPYRMRPTISSKLGSFIDHYYGGWQELFPNADEACIYKGAELGLHGEVCLIPWECFIILDDPEEISVNLSVKTYRTPFRLEKRMTLKIGSPILLVQEEVHNLGDETMDFMWGLHPALGRPFLSNDCVLSLPQCRVRTDAILGTDFSRITPDQDVDWPFVESNDGTKIDLRQVPSEDAKCNDRVFLYGFQDAWYAVRNRKTKMVFGMTWDKDTFPWLLYWQSFNGWQGYPFYGKAYTLSLEPRSSFPFPLTKVIKHNSQLKLNPGASLKTTYRAVATSTTKDVGHITPNGKIVEQE